MKHLYLPGMPFHFYQPSTIIKILPIPQCNTPSRGGFPPSRSDDARDGLFLAGTALKRPLKRKVLGDATHRMMPLLLPRRLPTFWLLTLVGSAHLLLLQLLQQYFAFLCLTVF